MENILNLLKISVIVSCVVLALILLKPVLNRRYHAKWKYYVWLLLAAALLLPLSPAGRQLAEVTEEHAPIQITVPDIDRGYVLPEETVTPPAEVLAPPAPVENAPTGTAQEPSRDSVSRRPAAGRRSPEDWAALVWVMGMAAFAGYYAVGTAVFYRRSLRRSREADEKVLLRAKELMEEMGIRRAVPVRISSAVTSPMMIGFFRPKLLLNEGDYSPVELDFILRHELTHHKRGDIWYKLALLCANCVHWFNPFAWLMVREAAVDMELTCDDAVVAGGDAAVRRAYSETLLASLHRQSGVNAALSTFFYGGKETMKERFRNIMGAGRRRKGVVALLLVLVVTVAAACLIGCQVAGNEEESAPLSAEELAAWQEKLDSVEYNGFVTHMYSEAKYIHPGAVLYLGAGVDHEAGEAEVAAYLAAIGQEELFTDVTAISSPALEQFLMEHTGLAFPEFAAQPAWDYVEEYDSYYFQHGDTNYNPVKVLSGTKKGDVITLEIEDRGGATMGGTLTIVDDKIVSYTNSVYSAVEAMAQTQVQELYQEGTTEKTWLESLWLGPQVQGEDGVYQEWWASIGVQYAENAQVVDPGINGRVSYAGKILVYVDEDGTVMMREAGYSEGDWHPLEYHYMDLSFEEYVRYCCEMELDLAARRQGWPVNGSQLIYAIHAGSETWTQKAEEVAKGWCLSMGDELEEYALIDSWESSAEMSGADVLMQVVTKQGRTVRLLLSRVLTDFHDVADWEVLEHKLVGGSELPKQRVGEDTRSEVVTLSETLEGMEEQVPCYLYSGGGDYGIREWSMYIPYENWSCNYLTNRWCPMPEDMALSIQVLEHGSSYSFEQFYRSYAEQFDQVWTNEDQIALGANVAHAVGYQDTAGGRYTESQLFSGNGKFYEVMWTYSAEQAEGWGTRLGWTAATFGIIGDDTAYETGEVRDAADDRPSTYLQKEPTADRVAGTYLMLPKSGKMFRLEQYVGVEKGVADFEEITTYLQADGAGVLVYSTRLDGKDSYLGVAHDGKTVTKTVAVGKDMINAPDNRILSGVIRGMLEETDGGAVKLITADGSDPYVKAGTYMVLPGETAAFRLEDGFADYADEWLRFQQMIDSRHPARYKDYRINGFTYAYRYDEVDGLPMMVFSVDWDVKIDPPLEWKKAAADGYSDGETAWLAVEYDGSAVTRTLVMLDSGGRPGDATFLTDMRTAIEEGEATVHTVHPAVFYDSAAGKLFAVHSNPIQKQ